MNRDVLRQTPPPTPIPQHAYTHTHTGGQQFVTHAVTMTAVGVSEGASVKRRKQDNLSVERRLC